MAQFMHRVSRNLTIGFMVIETFDDHGWIANNETFYRINDEQAAAILAERGLEPAGYGGTTWITYRLDGQYDMAWTWLAPVTQNA